MKNEEVLKARLKTRYALLIVDMQNDFCHEDGVCAKGGRDVSVTKKILPNIQSLIDGCHTTRAPVIFIQNTSSPETDTDTWISRPQYNKAYAPLCRIGTWGCEFFGVHPSEDDLVVQKHRYSAFIHTKLETVLHTLKVETLILTGVSTNVCVESTARDGFMLDYHILFVADSCSSYSPKMHEAALQNITDRFGIVVNAADITGLING
jgi:ureidoacrylate peracid hydrolase